MIRAGGAKAPSWVCAGGTGGGERRYGEVHSVRPGCGYQGAGPTGTPFAGAQRGGPGGGTLSPENRGRTLSCRNLQKGGRQEVQSPFMSATRFWWVQGSAVCRASSFRSQGTVHLPCAGSGAVGEETRLGPRGHCAVGGHRRKQAIMVPVSGACVQSKAGIPDLK